VGTIIELESGLNDPMAVILTVAVTESLLGESANGWDLAWEIPVQLFIGLSVGLVFGFVARAIMLRIRLSTGALYPVLTLGVAFLAFGLGTLLHGSGFLAVFVTGVVLGNASIPFRSGLRRIHDALAWLSQIAMFVMLGLLVFPSQLLRVAPVGLAIGLFLAFVARPLSVLLCLWPLRFSTREMSFIGWVGLRGAVPIILAIFPVLAQVPGAVQTFNIVFFVVAMNAMIPGATIRAVTRRMGFEEEQTPAPLAALEINSTRLLSGELMTFYISSSLAVCDALLSQIPFPSGASVILVVRGEQLLAARGDTRLLAGDHVYVFCQPGDKLFIEFLFGRSDSDS
jgi:cell volume regulation protein A